MTKTERDLLITEFTAFAEEQAKNYLNRFGGDTLEEVQESLGRYNEGLKMYDHITSEQINHYLALYNEQELPVELSRIANRQLLRR